MPSDMPKSMENAFALWISPGRWAWPFGGSKEGEQSGPGGYRRVGKGLHHQPPHCPGSKKKRSRSNSRAMPDHKAEKTVGKTGTRVLRMNAGRSFRRVLAVPGDADAEA